MGISILLLLVCLAPVTVSADSTPALVISQFKITSSNGQFVTLYNQTDQPLNLAEYELDYISSSNKLSSLPISGVLPAKTSYMLSDDQVRLCYQMIVDATSLSLTTTSGSLQIWNVSTDGMSKSLQDRVSWASKAAAGAVTLPSQNSDNAVSLLRQTTDPANLMVAVPGDGTWQTVQPDPANPCALQTVANVPVAPPTNPGNQLELGAVVPGSIVNLASDDSTASEGPVMPSADQGLMAPQISELLPNTASDQDDSSDEFIELYNPNPVAFDLSGFILQVGTTTLHKFTFPAGTILAAQSFGTYYSADTNLSMSNSGGRAALLDPFGNTISQSEVYGTAKDGLAWATAKGAWYWTTTPTPGKANSIAQTVSSTTKKTTSKSSSKTTTKTKSASTNPITAAAGTVGSTANAQTVADVTPIHPWTLAAMAGLAVLYGLYEYRTDVANRIHQLRKYRTTRLGNRQ